MVRRTLAWMKLAKACLAAVWLVGAATNAVAQGTSAFGRTIEVMKALPQAQKHLALAAEVNPEGHWTFVNAAGERFTTASPEELKRVLPTLAPEATKPASQLTLVVSEDTMFLHRRHFQTLPLAADRRTEVKVVVDAEAYDLIRRGDRANERFYAEVKTGLLVEITERRLFDEAVWQLSHPLKRGSVRVLALEPGGPASIPPSPRLDPTTQRALTDQLDPAILSSALRSLAGQTVILTVRSADDTLAFRPSSGPEQTLPAKDVLAAAEAADVNLVLLQSATPRQPGTRSWLWQRVSVTRLDDALGRDRLADFLNAVGSPQAKLLVSVQDLAPGRVRLAVSPLRDDGSSGLGEAWNDIYSNIAGQVVVSGIEASLRDRARQAELDRRLVPGVPSPLQWIYAGLLALGLLGHRIAKGWWSRIWPPEHREAYSGVPGYFAAQAVRGFVYGALFMPAVAIASAPLSLVALFSRKPVAAAEAHA